MRFAAALLLPFGSLFPLCGDFAQVAGMPVLLAPEQFHGRSSEPRTQAAGGGVFTISAFPERPRGDSPTNVNRAETGPAPHIEATATARQALCMRSATVTCCSRGLLRRSPPSSFVFSSAMPPRNLRDCCNSTHGLCGSPPPVHRPPLWRHGARSIRPTLHRFSRTWATRRATTSCATRS